MALATSVVALAALSQRRLPARTRPRGRPRTYSDASILLLALLGRLWHLSTREVCCSDAARAIIERFFGIAKRHDHLDTAEAVGWEPVVIRMTLTFCAILVVALAAHHAGAPELRLSPTRVLAHYLPVQEVA